MGLFLDSRLLLKCQYFVGQWGFGTYTYSSRAQFLVFQDKVPKQLLIISRRQSHANFPIVLAEAGATKNKSAF